jgi:hypothetical protein
MVSKKSVGFGKFLIAPFNCAKALLAEMVFSKIALVSKSCLGGSAGSWS